MQKAPCGADNGASLSFTTQAEQSARLDFVAELTDALIRAQLLNDTAAASFVTAKVPDSPFVHNTELKASCYASGH